MDWFAVITNLNSSDTGCLDYETVIECLTCDKTKRTVHSTWKPPAAKYLCKSFAQSFTQGGVTYLETQSIGLRGVLFQMLCNYKKYALN